MGLDLVQAGSVLGDRYEIRRLIRTAPGLRVWEAFDPVLKRTVIIDALDPRNTNATRDSFLSAALRSARCTNHGVIGVYDTGTEHGTAYVVSEFVRGTPLDTVIATEGALPLEAAANLTCEAADALNAAHATGLFHGALQASSILVTPAQRVKIGGFGSPPTRDRYCAPEILNGAAPSEAGDLYALAVCTAEMLCGHEFDPRDESLDDALAGRTDLPNPIRAALHRALDPDPRARAGHVRALHRAFAPVRSVVTLTPDQQSTEAVPVVTPEPTVAIPLIAAAPAEPSTEPPLEQLTVARHRGSTWFALTLAVIGIMAITFGVTAYLTLKNPFDLGTDPPPQPVRIAAVQDFDPFGDNGRENHQAVDQAIDGDPATLWSSEIYASPDFGNAKPGVGLRITLTDPARVGRINVATTEPGWSASVYAGDGTATTLADWGAAVASITDAPEQATITLPTRPTTRSILVWFTRLPAGGQMNVSEVNVTR